MGVEDVIVVAFRSKAQTIVGSLKTKISLKPQHQQMPFALMQSELPRISEINGRLNLLQQYDVQPPPSVKGDRV